MRYITSDMLNKANKRIQSVATGANPKMKVLTSRGLVKEMFRVFDVEDTAVGASTNSDVTIQRSTFGRPSQIFLTHLKNGQIEVKTKTLPYYEDVSWNLAFTISTSSGIKDSAIEFDGYWQRKQGEKRFDFISEELPYIFYVTNSGELYCQRWSKGADKIQLATGVRAISVVRGWVPVQAGHYDDQGLIVAYIKNDGMVYYRNYCINLAGSKSWEIERLVPGLPSGAARVSTFRTNDFRVGFLAETLAGGIHMAVTDRNWAGLAVEQHTISVNTNAEVEMIPVSFHDVIIAERISVGTNAEVAYLFGATWNEFTFLMNVEHEGDWGRYIEFELKNESFSMPVVTLLDNDSITNLPISQLIAMSTKRYRVKISEEMIPGINNVLGKISITVSGLVNEAGYDYETLNSEFTPMNLIPQQLPVPEVEEVWNE